MRDPGARFLPPFGEDRASPRTLVTDVPDRGPVKDPAF